jgi:hypothetical protein
LKQSGGSVFGKIVPGGGSMNHCNNRPGGLELFKKRGSEYMRVIGKHGAIALYKKYRLVPYGTSRFKLVLR